MPGVIEPRPSPAREGKPPSDPKRSLLQSLKDAHEADHEILRALGIKHPHVPILSVVEMLEHLRDKHVDE